MGYMQCLVFLVLQNICTNVEERFSDIKKSATLNLYWILSLGLLTEIAVFLFYSMMPSNISVKHFKEVIVKNDCDITKVSSQWLTLKTQSS